MADARNPLALFTPRQPTLAEKVATLGSELAELATAVRHYAGPKVHDAADGAAHYAQDLGHQLEPVARDIARQARRTAIAVRNDPVPTMIAVATLVLLASLFTRRQ